MQAWERVVEFAPFTATFNATGQPAMSVPLYWNEDNLPLGTHFAQFGYLNMHEPLDGVLAKNPPKSKNPVKVK
jgi:hypothetical protein